MLKMPAVSKEYVLVDWAATIAGVAVNPTSPALPVEMAFPVRKSPPTTFYTAIWEAAGAAWKAGCLVGPGGTVTLPVGDYDVYVKVTSTPEIPIHQATAFLRIY